MTVMLIVLTIVWNIVQDKAIDLAVDYATDKVVKVYEDRKAQKEAEEAGP